MECSLFSPYDYVTSLYFSLLYVKAHVVCVHGCTCVCMSFKQVTLKESLKVRHAKSLRAAASWCERDKLQRLKQTQSVFQHA